MQASRNYWIDLALAFLAVILTLSSFLLCVVLPQAYFRNRLVRLEIHKWSGLAVTVAVLIHHALPLALAVVHDQAALRAAHRVATAGPETSRWGPSAAQRRARQDCSTGHETLAARGRRRMMWGWPT